MNFYDGLFMPSDLPKALCTVQVPIDPGQSEADSLTFAIPATAYDRTVPHSGTFSRRASCFQDFILSMQILWFTDGRIHWQCNGCFISEMGTPGSLSYRIGPHPHWSNTLEEWKAIIHNYSGCLLTNADDLLVAIQGLFDITKEIYPTAEYQYRVSIETQPPADPVPHWIHGLMCKRKW